MRSIHFPTSILLFAMLFTSGCGQKDSADAPPAKPSTKNSEPEAQDHPAPDMWASSYLGTIGLTYKDDRKNKTGFVLIDSDTIATSASWLFGAKEGVVQLNCCDPKQVLGIVAYDMARDIVLVRIDPPVENVVSMPITELGDSPLNILFTLPVSFEIGPAFSTVPTEIEQHVDWAGIGETFIFSSAPDLVMDGSLVINNKGFPLAMITGWGGGNRNIGVPISQIVSLDRRELLPLERFTPSQLPKADQSYAHVYEARNLRNGGRLQGALEHAKKSVALDPNNWHAWYELGVLHDLLEADLTEAESALKRSVSIEDQWSEGLYSLGLIEYKQGTYTDAIESLKKAIKLDPSNPDAHSMYGLSVWQSQGPLMAVVHLEAACNLAPETFMHLDNLNLCYSELDQPRNGLQRTKQFVADSPDDIHGRRELGLLAFKLKESQLAIEQFSWLDEHLPPDSDTLIRLIICQLDTGDRSSAKKSLDKLESIDPAHELLPKFREELKP